MSTATLPAPSPSDFAARLPALGPRIWHDKRVYLRYPKPYEGGAGGGDLGWVDFTGELPRFVGKAPADPLELIRAAPEPASPTQIAALRADALELAARGYAEGRRATGRLGMADDHRAHRFAALRRILGREGTTPEHRAYTEAYETELIRLTSE